MLFSGESEFAVKMVDLSCICVPAAREAPRTRNASSTDTTSSDVKALSGSLRNCRSCTVCVGKASGSGKETGVTCVVMDDPPLMDVKWPASNETTGSVSANATNSGRPLTPPTNVVTLRMIASTWASGMSSKAVRKTNSPSASRLPAEKASEVE